MTDLPPLPGRSGGSPQAGQPPGTAAGGGLPPTGPPTAQVPPQFQAPGADAGRGFQQGAQTSWNPGAEQRPTPTRATRSLGRPGAGVPVSTTAAAVALLAGLLTIVTVAIAFFTLGLWGALMVGFVSTSVLLPGVVAVGLALASDGAARREGRPAPRAAWLATVAGGVVILLGFIALNAAVFEINDIPTFDEMVGEGDEFNEMNTDPSDGECDFDRFIQDPDC